MDGITDSMDMGLGELRELVMDAEEKGTSEKKAKKHKNLSTSPSVLGLLRNPHSLYLVM